MTGIGGRQASDMLTDALLAARDSRLLNSSGAATIGSSMLALAVVVLVGGTAEVEVVEVIVEVVVGIVEVSAAACIALNLIILNNLVIYPEP